MNRARIFSLVILVLIWFSSIQSPVTLMLVRRGHLGRDKLYVLTSQTTEGEKMSNIVSMQRWQFCPALDLCAKII